MFLKFLKDLTLTKKEFNSCWETANYFNKRGKKRGVKLIIKIGASGYYINNLITLMQVTKKDDGSVYIHLNTQNTPKENEEHEFTLKKYELFLKIKNYIEENKNNFVLEQGAGVQQLEQYTPLNVPTDYSKKLFWRTLFLPKTTPTDPSTPSTPAPQEPTSGADYTMDGKGFLKVLAVSFIIAVAVILLSLFSKNVMGSEAGDYIILVK
jgi:hypothetical protein